MPMDDSSGLVLVVVISITPILVVAMLVTPFPVFSPVFMIQSAVVALIFTLVLLAMYRQFTNVVSHQISLGNKSRPYPQVSDTQVGLRGDATKALRNPRNVQLSP